jgi:glycosyltransferase involved in cell wall biosynthesis
MNPLGDLSSLLTLARWYRVEKPDLAHHHTVKCVLYGTYAAALAGVPAVLNSVTGLGHLFLRETPLVKAVRFFVLALYRFAAHWKGVHFLFQNPDDLSVFERLGVVRPGKFTLVRGSGIDVEHFRPAEGERAPGPVRILFGSRLLKEKGLYELRQAALRMRRNPSLSFELIFAGELDEGNPSSLTFAELSAWQEEGWMRWLGHVDDMCSLLRSVDISVLPSWREGLPRSLLEAAACGLPIVSTDVPGSREVVEPEKSGLLVPVRDPEALAASLERLVRDPALRARLGAAARRRAETEFAGNIIYQKTITIYELLFSQA